MRHASCGNGGAMEREESQKEAFLSFHSSLEISPPTRDSHISTAPATRPVFVEQRKTARRIYLGGWESGNPEAGFPLSHRPDQPAAQGKNHFEKQLKTKAVYTKLLTPPSEVKAELRRRMHDPLPEVGQWLRSVVGGHIRYYGVPMNGPGLRTFRSQVGWLWYRTLSRRSQNGRVPWDRMRRLIARWLPPARISHPYPLRRRGVVTEARAGCGQAARPDLWRGCSDASWHL